MKVKVCVVALVHMEWIRLQKRGIGHLHNTWLMQSRITRARTCPRPHTVIGAL